MCCSDRAYMTPHCVSVHREIYNATLRKDTRNAIIATAGWVCNSTRRLRDGVCFSLCQRVRGSVSSVSTGRNTRVFLTETRFVADDSEDWLLITPFKISAVQFVAAQLPEPPQKPMTLL